MSEIGACRRCAELPLGPRPVVRVLPSARLLLISHAPGTKAHETGLSFSDRNGDRLRRWLGLDRYVFTTRLRSRSCRSVSAIPVATYAGRPAAAAGICAAVAPVAAAPFRRRRADPAGRLLRDPALPARAPPAIPVGNPHDAGATSRWRLSSCRIRVGVRRVGSPRIRGLRPGCCQNCARGSWQRFDKGVLIS
jgi:hypothetical protein